MKLKLNNNGSATITVIITMLLVMALGSALLFASYTSYKIALAEREDIKTFYTAEAAMDDIRAGVQNAVSEALSLAYTDTFTAFAKAPGGDFDPQKEFSKSFVAALAADRDMAGNSREPFYQKEANKYNALQLQKLIAAPLPEGCSVSAGGGAVLTVVDETYTALTLERVTLRWIENGYESDLMTDIVINVPSFAGKLGDFSVVAEGGILQNGGGSSIKGSVYSGADVAISSGSLALDGKIFVADDLVLEGSGSIADLSGEYYGFGSSATNASESSAILINGRNTTLNLDGLTRLSLAGRSFISVVPENMYAGVSGTGEIKNDLSMGQSMAFKSNQLAYLAPVECLKNYASNPCQLRKAEGTDEYVAIEPNADAVLWDNKTLQFYGGELKTMYKSLGADTGIKIGYLFISFSDPLDANRYFKDYFTQDPELINQYKDFYINSLHASASGSITAAGNTFAEKGDTLELVEAAGGADTMGHRLSDFVNETAVTSLPDGARLEFKQGGVNVLIVDGDYSLTGAYNGLIITSGRLTLNPGASITAGAVTELMLSATCNYNGRTYYLSNFLKSGFDNDAPSYENAWASNKLVVYKNWTKN